MRYYILLFVFLILSSINAQEKYASFKQPSGNVVDIQIDTDKLQVYFPLHYSGDSGIILENEKSRLAFLDFLNSSFDKFEEWKKTAKENDVKDFDKEICSYDLLSIKWQLFSSEYKKLNFFSSNSDFSTVSLDLNRSLSLVPFVTLFNSTWLKAPPLPGLTCWVFKTFQ